MTIRMQEAEAAGHTLASVLAHLSAGHEVLIERDGVDVALVLQSRPPREPGRHVDEILSILRNRELQTGPVIMTPDFAADVREAHEFWNQPINSPWD